MAQAWSGGRGWGMDGGGGGGEVWEPLDHSRAPEVLGIQPSLSARAWPGHGPGGRGGGKGAKGGKGGEVREPLDHSRAPEVLGIQPCCSARAWPGHGPGGGGGRKGGEDRF